MGARLASGIVAGLAGGAVFAALASVMADMVAGSGVVTLMELIGKRVGSGSLPITWTIILGAGVLLGAIFGVFTGRAAADGGRVASYALFYGLGLGIVVGFVAVPLLLGIPLSRRAIWAWIPATLMAGLLFTSVLAGTFALLQRGRAAARHTREELRRAA